MDADGGRKRDVGWRPAGRGEGADTWSQRRLVRDASDWRVQERQTGRGARWRSRSVALTLLFFFRSASEISTDPRCPAVTLRSLMREP